MGVWHHVIVKYDRVAQGMVRLSYWIDGIEVGSDTSSAFLPDEDGWNWALFEAGDGPAWIDDVKLYR
ncbi:MAG: hypothetical protein AB1726_02565 [Planctomycetota bacterium]